MGIRRITARATSLSAGHRSLVVLLIWGVAMIAGSGLLAAYSSAPADAAAIAAAWPRTRAITRSETQPTLVMFVHPRCPCSRASIRELARIVRHGQHALSVHVLFYQPADQLPTWSRTDLWQSARAIPGVTVGLDLDGSEARRFGATTSGHAVVYDTAGRLRFSGGITVARGHEGDSTGAGAILDLVQGRRPRAQTSPIFGCPILPSPVCAAEGGDECPE